jgi:hypothetical protein
LQQVREMVNGRERRVSVFLGANGIVANVERQ